MVNWTELLSTQKTQQHVRQFATGAISGEALQSSVAGTAIAGEVRKIVRPGVSRGRSLARKALRSRGLL